MVRFGSEVYRVIFAAKKRTDAVDKNFRESIQTLPAHERRRDGAGAAAAASRWWRCRRGDTVDKLARRMAVADRHAERFRVLNGMGDKDRLRPGDYVKVVVE